MNAEGFGLVEGVTNTCRVDQPQRDSADGNGFTHQIPCSPWGRGDDGALALDQAVEEARLADVGSAYDGERQPLVHDLAECEGVGKLFQRRADFR